MTFNEIAQKKIFNIPVLYIAAAAVIVLAIVAWRMKPSPDTDTSGVDPENALDGITDIDGVAVSPGNPYAGYNTSGTVVVAPQQPEEPEVIVKTNEDWVKESAEWLTASKKATGIEAASALNKFVSGEDLSYDEGQLVNAAIVEKGQPPDSIGNPGTIGQQPARRQFSGSNGTHTVKGTNDNTYQKLAVLYYGNGDALHVNRIAEYNTKLGPATATFDPETKIVIPTYVNPVYYTVTGKNSDNRFKTIAAKAGATPAMIQALNPTISEPIPTGTKVRTY